MLIPNEMQFALSTGAVIPRWLVWVTARNRETGAPETAGFWTGDDDATFDVAGEARTYLAAGGLIGMDDLSYEAGTNVQQQRLKFSMLSPEVRAAVEQYSLRLAPVEIHLAMHDPETWEIIGLARAFRGTVEDPKISDGAKSEAGISTSTLELTVVSTSRAGTKTLAMKKSGASQRLRLATDKGRSYADLGGANIDVEWGEEDSSGYFVRR
jgi:hypothetical protein